MRSCIMCSEAYLIDGRLRLASFRTPSKVKVIFAPNLLAGLWNDPIRVCLA